MTLETIPDFSPLEIHSLAITPDRWILGTGHRDILVWNPAGSLKIIPRAARAAVYAVALSPEGGVMACGSESSTFRLGDLDSWTLVDCKGDTGAITALSFSPDGQTLVGGRALWDRSGRRIRRKCFGAGALFAPDGESVISGPVNWSDGDQGTLLWELDLEGRTVRTFPGETRPGLVAVSPDGSFIAADTRDAHIHLWDRKGRLLLIHRHPGPAHYNLSGLAFGPDGHRIASGCWGQPVVHLWDLSGRPLGKLPGYQPRTHSNGLVFLPDGRHLAGISPRGVRIWQVQTGRTLELSWSAEGHWLAQDDRGRFDTSRDDLLTAEGRQPGLMSAFLAHE
jgi:WD40 repeat protein